MAKKLFLPSLWLGILFGLLLPFGTAQAQTPNCGEPPPLVELVEVSWPEASQTWSLLEGDTGLVSAGKAVAYLGSQANKYVACIYGSDGLGWHYVEGAMPTGVTYSRSAESQQAHSTATTAGSGSQGFNWLPEQLTAPDAIALATATGLLNGFAFVFLILENRKAHRRSLSAVMAIWLLVTAACAIWLQRMEYRPLLGAIGYASGWGATVAHTLLVVGDVLLIFLGLSRSGEIRGAPTGAVFAQSPPYVSEDEALRRMGEVDGTKWVVNGPYPVGSNFHFSTSPVKLLIRRDFTWAMVALLLLFLRTKVLGVTALGLLVPSSAGFRLGWHWTLILPLGTILLGALRELPVEYGQEWKKKIKSDTIWSAIFMAFFPVYPVGAFFFPELYEIWREKNSISHGPGDRIIIKGAIVILLLAVPIDFFLKKINPLWPPAWELLENLWESIQALAAAAAQ